MNNKQRKKICSTFANTQPPNPSGMQVQTSEMNMYSAVCATIDTLRGNTRSAIQLHCISKEGSKVRGESCGGRRKKNKAWRVLFNGAAKYMKRKIECAQCSPNARPTPYHDSSWRCSMYSIECIRRDGGQSRVGIKVLSHHEGS